MYIFIISFLHATYSVLVFRILSVSKLRATTGTTQNVAKLVHSPIHSIIRTIRSQLKVKRLAPKIELK